MNKKEILNCKLDVYRKMMKDPKFTVKILKESQTQMWGNEKVSDCNKVLKQNILERKDK